MYPTKQKDICDYDPRCIMYSGLMFDDIIMGIIRNNKFPQPTEETDCRFTKNDKNIIYMYRGSLQYFYWKKGTYEHLKMPNVNIHLKNYDMKDYLTQLFKNGTLSGLINEKVDHWLDSFEKFHKKYIIMSSPLLNYLFLEESLFVTV